MANVAKLNSVALPRFGDKMDPADGEEIWNCLYQLREQVVYQLQNIDPGNFSNETRSQYDGMLSRLYSSETGGAGSAGSSTEVILTRLGALESRAARIEGSMETLTGRVSELEGGNKALNDALTGLAAQVEALTGRVSKLEGENKTLNEALAALAARVEALEKAPEGGA